MTGTELKILDWLQTIHTPIGDTFMCFITSLGNAGIIWIVLAAILLAIPKTRKSGIIVAAALIIDAVLCNVILKNVFHRIRPFDVNTAVQLLIEKPGDFSFPSGHTAASFAVVSALYLAKARKLFAPVLVLSCLMAFSRMYLYVHYPTDIIGGLVLGIVSAVIAYKCQESQKILALFHRNKYNTNDIRVKRSESRCKLAYKRIFDLLTRQKHE